MDFLKTLLAYMTASLIVAVESTATPSVTPVPTPSPTPGPAATAAVETVPTLPAPTETATPEAKPSVTPRPVPTITPNMKGYHNLLQGDRGQDVKRLQQRLIELGYLPEGSADGAFGGRTREAVRRFQYYNGLTVDGIAGRATQTNLFENPDVAPYPTETPEPEPTATPLTETAAPAAEEAKAPETVDKPAEKPAEAPAQENAEPVPGALNAEPEAAKESAEKQAEKSAEPEAEKESAEAPAEKPAEPEAEKESAEAPAAEKPAEAEAEKVTAEAPAEKPAEPEAEKESAETPAEEKPAEPEAEKESAEAPAETAAPKTETAETAEEAKEPAPETDGTPDAELVENVDLDEQEPVHSPAPEAEPESAYEDLAGWVTLNDSGESLQLTELADGVPVVRSPRLQKRDDDIRVSLDDLCESLEGWELTEEGNSLLLTAQGYTLALLNEENGFAAAVDGLEMTAESSDFDFGEGHFIRAEFLTRALDGSWEWNAEEETLMLRIDPKKSPLRND